MRFAFKFLVRLPVIAALTVLVGCSESQFTESSTPTSPNGVQPTTATVESPLESTSSPPMQSAPPTTGNWDLNSIQSANDCQRIMSSLGTGQVSVADFPADDHGPFFATMIHADVWRESLGYCAVALDNGEKLSLHVGSTADGRQVPTPLFGGGVDEAENVLDNESFGAGVIYFGEFDDGFSSFAACHYVEGSKMVSHARPIDGRCRSTLRDVIDDIRS